MKIQIFIWIRIIYAVLGGLLIFVSPAESESVHTLEILSSPLTIDRIYRSMEGPTDNRVVTLTKDMHGEKKDIVWLLGLKTEILDAETNAPKSQEYLCHITFASNKKILKSNAMLTDYMKYQYPKLLSLFQSQTAMHFPKHFAMPALSTDDFFVVSMVLNNNEIPKKPFQLKVKDMVDYVYDRELNYKMNPLFRRSYILKVPVKGMSSASHCASEEGEGPKEDQLEQKTAEMAKASWEWLEKDADGNTLATHWMVPPGRHIYRYRLPEGLEIPDDTTAHYISAHLHAFGQYMAIRDLTTGKTVFKARVKNYKDRRGIAYSDYYSSEKGIVFRKDHRYELICEYNNTTSQDVDAMAMMLVFYLDRTFDKKKLMELKNYKE